MAWCGLERDAGFVVPGTTGDITKCSPTVLKNGKNAPAVYFLLYIDQNWFYSMDNFKKVSQSRPVS
jgi:hypothetical protein